MSYYESKKLREELAKIADESGKMISKASEEKRDLTSDEDTKFNAIHEDVAKLMKRIEQAEKAESVRSYMSDVKVKDVRSDTACPETRKALASKGEMDEFRGWLRGEQRALSSSGASSGQTLIPSTLSDQIFSELKAYGTMRNVAKVITTGAGEVITIPTSTDIGNSASIISESGTITDDTDNVFGSVTLPVYSYKTTIIRVPWEFLNDSIISLESFLVSQLAVRIGRGTENHFVNGTGTGQPRGIVTAAPEGHAGNVTYENLIQLKHSVDPSYRANAKWVMSDDAFKYLRTETDDQNRPLWVPNLAVGEPSMLDGQAMYVNNEMPADAPVVYGDFSHYIIRDVGGLNVVRLNEKYATSGQVGFMCWFRSGGNLAHDSSFGDAQAPVKKLVNATGGSNNT